MSRRIESEASKYDTGKGKGLKRQQEIIFDQSCYHDDFKKALLHTEK